MIQSHLDLLSTQDSSYLDYINGYSSFCEGTLDHDYDEYFNINNVIPSIDFVHLFVFSGINIFPFLRYLICFRRYKNMFQYRLTIYGEVHIISIRKVVIRGFHKGYMIRLEHPTRNLVNYVHNILDQNNIDYIVSTIEYSLDIYTPHYELLLHYCKISAMLTYMTRCDAVHEKYKTTSYLGNPRTTRTKAGRAYIKKINGINVLRIEVLLKNETIKNSYPHGKNLVSMSSRRADDIFKRFRFRHIKLNTLFKRIRNKFSLTPKEALYILYFQIIQDILKDGIHTAYKNIIPYAASGKSKYNDIVKHPLTDDFYDAIQGKTFI